MKELRRQKLRELLAGPRFNGDRDLFLSSAGITKGRLSQLLDPEQPFGDTAVKNLSEKLGVPASYFNTQIVNLSGTGSIGQFTATATLSDGANQPLAPAPTAQGAININTNRRAPLEPKDIVAALGALLAGVEPGRIGTVIAALADLARSPADEVLRDSLARLIAPQAFVQQGQRTG